MQTNTAKTAKPAPDRPNVIYSLLRQVGGESGDWVLLALGFLAGALAFLWAGYRGNPTDPNRFIREPWSLFAYFCLAMIVLEASILLDPNLPAKRKPSRARVITTLAVTLGWIAVLSVVYLIGRDRFAAELQRILPGLASGGAWLGGHKQVIFILANLVCIVILWLGIHFTSFDSEMSEMIETEIPESAITDDDIPTRFRGERFAGDLLLSTFFSVILAWAFFWPVWQSINALAAPGHQPGGAKAVLTVCDLTFLPFSSPCVLSPFDLTTIFMLDLVILPLVYLGSALVILGFQAWHQALERGRAEEFPIAFQEALRDVINRRVTLPNLLLALRFIWPFLLLVATFLVGVASKAIAQYLFNVAMASNGRVFWLDLSWPTLGLQFGAVAAIVIAMAVTVSATTLQVFPQAHDASSLRRELAFSWRHVRFFALMLALSYWVFSVIFSIINELALIGVREYEIVANHGQPLNGYHWAPFIQPDPLMLLSLVVFLIFATRQPRVR